MPKGYAVFYFWVLWCQIAHIQNLHHSYCIRSIPGHCDLQTDILNCLGDIISCPQIDLTLPAGANILADQFVWKVTQNDCGLATV